MQVAFFIVGFAIAGTANGITRDKIAYSITFGALIGIVLTVFFRLIYAWSMFRERPAGNDSADFQQK